MLAGPFGASFLQFVNPRPLPPRYVILAQKRSLTGLVSVVEKKNGHRMMTADLSVLGGYQRKKGYAPDSIFSQFHVHEAVRLSKRNVDLNSGERPTALCIGVGVGVVAKAFREHKVRVDAVELDKMVAAYASDWFNLYGGIIVDDGIKFVANRRQQHYDFVVHDVFTGGSISTFLVNTKVLETIRDAMKTNGVFAINIVAGVDGASAAVTRVVYDRLKRTFGYVRIFSDGDQGLTHNIVLFASCDEMSLQFRQAVEDDFLESESRRKILTEFEMCEVRRQDLPNGRQAEPMFANIVEELELRYGMAVVSFLHTYVMREVHPPALFPALLAAERWEPLS